jgi:hypothetical protein
MSDYCHATICGNSTSLSGCHGRDLTICAGSATNGSVTGGTLVFSAGSGVSADGRIKMQNLPAKSTETCVVYIDNNGGLSQGTVSGGLDAFAALTSNSSVSWNTSVGLNKTWSINNSYTLTLTNVASGMFGTVKVTVTSGAPTITLAGSGITFKGNGNLSTLANGTYILSWVASSSSTVEWNIGTYA